MIRIPLHAYAKAYVRTAPNAHAAVGDLEAIRSLFRAAPEVAAFAADGAVSANDRIQAIRIGAANVSAEAVNFALLLASHRLLSRFDRIIELVADAAAAETGTVRASATSAVPLTDRERTGIVKALEQKTKRHVALTERIDPSVVGGLLIRLGDWEFDATVKNRVRRLQRALTL